MESLELGATWAVSRAEFGHDPAYDAGDVFLLALREPPGGLTHGHEGVTFLRGVSIVRLKVQTMSGSRNQLKSLLVPLKL